MCEEFVERGDIGQVAASLAGDAEFAAWVSHLFNNKDPGAARGSLASRHQAGRASAHDDQGCFFTIF